MAVEIVGSTTVDIWVLTGMLPARPGGLEFNVSNLATLDQQPSLRVGGNGGSAAAVVGGLGGKVTLFTNLGDDFWGAWARSQLAARGVEVLTPSGSRHTSVHIAVTDPQGARFSLFYPGQTAIPEAGCKSGARWILFGGCPHPIPSEIARMLHESSSRTTLLDIGPNLGQGFNFEDFTPLLRDLDWLIGNESEIADFTGQAPEQGARSVARMAREGVILKRGENGAAVFFRSGKPPLWGRPFSISPQCTIGAGDAFNGGLLYGLSRGWDWNEILRFSNAVAACSVQAPDGILAVPAASRILAFMDSRTNEGEVFS